MNKVNTINNYNTIDIGKYYAILPSISYTYSEEEFMFHHNAS